jgi:hypothetical protein
MTGVPARDTNSRAVAGPLLSRSLLQAATACMVDADTATSRLADLGVTHLDDGLVPVKVAAAEPEGLANPHAGDR